MLAWNLRTPKLQCQLFKTRIVPDALRVWCQRYPDVELGPLSSRPCIRLLLGISKLRTLSFDYNVVTRLPNRGESNTLRWLQSLKGSTSAICSKQHLYSFGLFFMFFVQVERQLDAY